MDLDQDFIVRRDFTTARRGYEPSEVEAHLRRIADAVADLQRQRDEDRVTLSGAAAERVRIILEAAEQSGDEIRRSSEQEAQGIVQDAERLAEQTQARADEESRSHVERVERETGLLFQRAERLESELDATLERARAAANALVESFRGEGNTLQADLEALKRELAESRASRGAVAEPEPAPSYEPEPSYAEPEPPSVAAAADAPATSVGATDFDQDLDAAEAGISPGDQAVAEEADAGPQSLEERELVEPSMAAEPPGAEDEAVLDEPDFAPEPATTTGAGAEPGHEGARLIALNMALNGTPREETAEYLRRTFNLEQSDQMLDEVYERARGG